MTTRKVKAAVTSRPDIVFEVLYVRHPVNKVQDKSMRVKTVTIPS